MYEQVFFCVIYAKAYVVGASVAACSIESKYNRTNNSRKTSCTPENKYKLYRTKYYQKKKKKKYRDGLK